MQLQRCILRAFSSKSPEFYANALSKGQQFAVIDAEVFFLFLIYYQGKIIDESTNLPFFNNSTPIKQTQFWRNLRRNNVRINEDYEFVSRIGSSFIFVNVANMHFDNIQCIDRPIVFHSYINKEVSILRDDSVVIDHDDEEVNSKHGVLLYGNDIMMPFVPKYLSMCLDNRIIWYLLLCR